MPNHLSWGVHGKKKSNSEKLDSFPLVSTVKPDQQEHLLIYR